MITTTTARAEAIAEVREWTIYRLANEADSGSGPDSTESAGAKFLDSVRDATLEAIEYQGEAFDPDTFDDDGTLHQIADDAPDVYTWQRWQEFADLSAWQEDVTEYGPVEDLTQAAGVALYMIAERLAQAIVSYIGEADES